MQFSCDSCKAQLQIADEKVRGKRLIVRCKRCGAKITISDPALGAARTRPAGSAPPPAAPAAVAARAAASPAPSTPQPVQRDSDTDSTRAMDSDLLEQALQASKAEEAPNGAPGSATPAAKLRPAFKPVPRSIEAPDVPVWFAMLHGKQTGPLTRAELRKRTDEGAVGPRTYLWKDGMDAWQRAKDLPELQGLFPQLPEAPSLPPPVAPPPARAQREFATPDFAVGPKLAPAPASAKPSFAPVSAKPSPAPAPVSAKRSFAPAPASAKPSFAPAPASAKLPFAPAPASAKSSFAPAKEEGTAVDRLPLGERVHQESVARALFTLDPDQLPKPPGLQPSAGAVAKTPASPRPSATPAPRMFEGAAQAASRGPFVAVVLAVVAVAAVVLWFVIEPGRASSPAPQKEAEAGKDASAAPVAAAPPAEEEPAEKPSAKPADKPEAPAPTGLTADQVRKKLDQNKAALQGCIDEALRRDPNLRVGKIHIATTIVPSGAVTQAKIDKGTVEQSPLGSCLRKATRKIAFPPFSGEALNVDIPIVVTAGE